MSRSFRFYEKKRGNRRTGSPKLGGLGEAVFFLIFLLLGGVGTLLVLFELVVPEWRVNHEFVETQCKVLEKRIAEKQGEDGLVFRPDIKIEYEVDHVVYRDWHYDIHRTFSGGRNDSQAAIAEFSVYDPAKDNRYPCWYDPMNPAVAVLIRDYRWWTWLAFTVPLSFVVIGAGGLIYTLLHWGTSAERRAAITQRVQDRDFFARGYDAKQTFPNVPQGVDMTNSPGTRLRFRLPMAVSPGWALFGSLAACVFWNGLVSVFVGIAIKSHLKGDPEWFLTFFIIPFVLIGLALIVYFFRQLLITAGVGTTMLEISDHPLHPGGQYRVFLSQSGRLMVNALRVSLVCEESATYRQGTDTRTETQEVFRREVFRREAFSIERGFPFETEMELDVDPGVMHSFKSDHNEISWSLAVEGDLAHWPDFKRNFSVILRPSVAEAGR